MRGAIPPLPRYVFMAWCSVKQRDSFNVQDPQLFVIICEAAECFSPQQHRFTLNAAGLFRLHLPVDFMAYRSQPVTREPVISRRYMQLFHPYENLSFGRTYRVSGLRTLSHVSEPGSCHCSIG